MRVIIGLVLLIAVPAFASPQLLFLAAVRTLAPSTPVIAAVGGNTTVTISLTSGGAPADSYDVKWGTVSGSRANTITGITLPYTHAGRTNGTAYYYSLVAINGTGSAESAEASATAHLIENGSAGWVKSEGGTGAAAMTLAYSAGEAAGDERKSRTKTLDLAPGTITIEGTVWAYDEDGATYGGIVLYIDDVQVAGGDEITPVVYESAYSGSHEVKIECYAGRDVGGPSPSPSSSVTSVSIPVQ